MGHTKKLFLSPGVHEPANYTTIQVPENKTGVNKYIGEILVRKLVKSSRISFQHEAVAFDTNRPIKSITRENAQTAVSV
jgi:N-acetylglucosamine kinase-like BadF-type ATPase